MKRQVRVWINQWFSTAYHIVNFIKEDNNIDFYFIGTSANNNSVIKLVCNEWYEEPVLNTKEYLEFALSFCKEHQIEVFMPRRHMQMASEYIEKFNEIGVKVLIESNYDLMVLLNNKVETYEKFKEFVPQCIPEIIKVNNVEGFSNGYKLMFEKYGKVCVKFAEDEGAQSFRVIDNQKQTFESLLIYPGMHISYEKIVELLSEKEEFKDLIIMPYLSGHEVSVDCLNTASGIVMIPRFKVGGRIEEIRFDKEILGLCKKIYEKINIEMPCNIQFKYYNETPYLLEINTRMSGGIQYACKATGVNIPNIAINQLLGINKSWEIVNKGKILKTAFVEEPVILSVRV